MEAGSLAKAAGSMNLPRSTVSKLLRDLESHLGVMLVSRSTRATTVTPEGEAYYDKAISLLADLDKMDAAAGGGAARPSGRLRVDVGSNIANLILIPELPGFLKLYPDVEIVLGVADRAVDLISEGIDCVIRGGPLGDSTLIARRLCELDYVLCAAPSYARGHGLPSTIEELQHHRVLGYFSALTGASFPLRFRVDGERREVRPPLMMSVNESTAHMTSLLAGLGIGQTFELFARPYLKDGRLIEALPDLQPDPHPLNLLYPASRTPSAKLRVFADWAVQTFQRVSRKAG